MMERAEFVNDLCCNYLTVPYGGEENDFALRMMMENVTDVFLPVEFRRLDGEHYLYYNISGLQNMEILYAEKPMDRKTFQTFMWQLHEAIEESRELFLPGDGICLEPSFLFWNMQRERWEFVYIPGREKREPADVQKERELLAEFFVMRIDYEDKNLTETVYRFYEEICSGKTAFTYFETEQTQERETVWETESGEQVTGEEPDEPERYGQESDGAETVEGEAKPELRRAGGSKIPHILLCILCFAAAAGTLLAGRTARNMILPGGAVTAFFAAVLLHAHKKQKTLYRNEEAENEDIIYIDREECLYDSKPPETEEREEVPSEETVYMDIRQEQERKLYGVGKFRQQRIFLDRLPCLIGKDKALVNHIIPDTSVSRMHARFFEEEHSLWVQDLNSKNGTYHNGLRLRPNEKVMLEPEDEIGFGRVQFVFR